MAESALSGMDISKIMSEEGTLVKCVILRCHPVKSDGGSDAVCSTANQPISELSIKQMKNELISYGVTDTFVEKAEMIAALEGARSKRRDNESNNKSTTDMLKEESTESKPKAAAVAQDVQVPLSHLIEEITIDTTPRKSQVAKLLGGDFTFLGQYEDEGIMVMIRRPDWDENDTHREDVPPINPHKLHPPLNDVHVRGDILLMRVAETREELDEESECDEQTDSKEEGADDSKESAQKKLHVPTNEEFFLDYTRDEYLKFAARTDVVWEEPEQDEDEEESEEEEEQIDDELEETKRNGAAAETTQDNEEEDANDPTYDPEPHSDSDEEYDSEEHQIGMMNLILGQILRKFHEENGRGPNTLELLDMRKALADKLGVEVPEVDEEACDWDKKVETPKRHNRKVVVDEEKNECETIECVEVHGEGEGEEGERDADDDLVEESLKRPAAIVENDSSGKSRESKSDISADEDESATPKRPAEAMVNGETENNEHMSKRAKLEDEVVANGES